jgi:hypothetical protein
MAGGSATSAIGAARVIALIGGARTPLDVAGSGCRTSDSSATR